MSTNSSRPRATLSAGRIERRGWRLLCFSVLIFLTPHLYADVGLIVETPTGLLGFASNVGHSSIWISHGCLDSQGSVRYCDDSPGIVLTSTAYWSNPGAAAIPAELFFLGSQPGRAGRGQVAWKETLGEAYPSVQANVGDKYLGRAWLRGMRVLTFTTTADEDRRVLEQVQAQRQTYRYSYSRRNCAFYAEQVLKLYLGDDFHSNRVLEFGIRTPRALERALLSWLRKDQYASYRTVHFRGTLLHSWRQPPRNICESAIFDPKYAIPLLLYEPYLYGGFAVCYGITRLKETGTKSIAHSLALLPAPETLKQDSHLTAYQTLTGKLPAGAVWTAASLANAGPGDAQKPDLEPVPAEGETP